MGISHEGTDSFLRTPDDHPGVSPTVYLREALPDARARIDAESVELRGNLLRIESTDGEPLVVPMENLAGVEGGEVERSVESIPTQGGQYTEVVTAIS